MAEPIIRFRADPEVIQPGESATLRWHVENVQAVYFFTEGERWREHGVVGDGEQQVSPSQTTTYYNRIGWAIATGAAQTITVTSSGAVTNIYANAYVVSNLADATDVTDGGSTSGTGASDVVLPDSPACMYAFHFLATGTTNTSTPVSAYDPPPGFCAENVAKGNSYSSYYCCLDKGGLTKSVKGASFAVANDTKWVVHSIFANGTPVGGGSGAGPGLFWGNNF